MRRVLLSPGGGRWRWGWREPKPLPGASAVLGAALGAVPAIAPFRDERGRPLAVLRLHLVTEKSNAAQRLSHGCSSSGLCRGRCLHLDLPVSTGDALFALLLVYPGGMSCVSRGSLVPVSPPLLPALAWLLLLLEVHPRTGGAWRRCWNHQYTCLCSASPEQLEAPAAGSLSSCLEMPLLSAGSVTP